MKDYAALDAKLNNPYTVLRDRERFCNWLKVLAHFPAVSEKNVTLIALQNPDATFLATYNTWQEMGTSVRSGEQSMAIKNLRGDAYIPVFDVSQTKLRQNAQEPVPPLWLCSAIGTLLEMDEVTSDEFFASIKGVPSEELPRIYIGVLVEHQMTAAPEQSKEKRETLKECLTEVMNIRYLQKSENPFYYMPGFGAMLTSDEQRSFQTQVYRHARSLTRSIDDALDKVLNLPELTYGYHKPTKQAETTKARETGRER